MDADKQVHYDDANRAYWDELAEFLAGESVLDPLVTAEVGDVRGKAVLHLQCHFGLDTLSLARLGAVVTGLDYSPKAIAAARALSAESGVPGHFVEGRVQDAPALIDGSFDMVFASWGAICWLPDLRVWARIVAHFLKPGGRLYLAEGHPLANSLDDGSSDPVAPLVLRYPFLTEAEPLEYENQVDYADETTAPVNKTTYDWNHGLGEVVTALCQAGLEIRFLHEHEIIPWRAIPQLVVQDDYFFRLPAGYPKVPLSFSLKAVKKA